MPVASASFPIVSFSSTLVATCQRPEFAVQGTTIEGVLPAGPNVRTQRFAAAAEAEDAPL